MWLGLAADQGEANPSKIDLDKTMIVLNQEFGRTPGAQDGRFGRNHWPYGYAQNRHVLDTFLRYHFEQGLSKRRVQPEELFVPKTMEAFKI